VQSLPAFFIFQPWPYHGAVCARGEVVTVQVPPDWIDKLKAESSKLKAKD
jgi:hypothetical protein